MRLGSISRNYNQMIEHKDLYFTVTRFSYLISHKCDYKQNAVHIKEECPYVSKGRISLDDIWLAYDFCKKSKTIKDTSDFKTVLSAAVTVKTRNYYNSLSYAPFAYSPSALLTTIQSKDIYGSPQIRIYENDWLMLESFNTEFMRIHLLDAQFALRNLKYGCISWFRKQIRQLSKFK